MAWESRHLSTRIARTVSEVYDYTSNPAHMPEWAPGLCDSIELVDGQWVAQSPMGRAVIAFAPRNEYGVLDHYVTVPSGETFYNPVRVIADGDSCEVVFTLRRQPKMSDDDFATDQNAVLADLVRLKGVLEQG